MSGKRVKCSLAAIFCIQLFFAFGAACAEDAERAKIFVAEPQYNFGNVSQGSKVVHEFELENKGGSELVIQRLVPACGCTASTVERHKVPPGESTKVKVEFDTTGFDGEKFKTVRVYTNDLDQPSTMLSLKGVVESDVIVEPQRVFFGEVVKGLDGSSNTKEVVVKIRKGSDAKLKGVKSYSKYLKIEERSGSEREKRFAVSLDGDVPLGEHRERIIVGIEGAQNRSINVPVFASVRGTLRLDPSTLSFGLIEGDKKIIRKVKFENLGKEPVKISEIQASDPSVSASYKEIVKGKKYVIQVAVDPSQVTKDLRASLSIGTDRPEQNSLSLNVYGIVPPKL